MKNLAWTTTLVPQCIVGTEKSAWIFDSFPLFTYFQVSSKVIDYFYFYALTDVNTFDALQYTTLHLLFFLISRLFHLWWMGVASSWLLGLFCDRNRLGKLSCFLVGQGVQAHLVLSRNPSLLKECWFFLVEYCIWDHDVGTRLLMLLGWPGFNHCFWQDHVQNTYLQRKQRPRTGRLQE